jgi:hypothetical protein
MTINRFPRISPQTAPRIEAPRAARVLWLVALFGLFSVLALRFCAVYFPLDPSEVGGPVDFEPYTAMDWLVARSLLQHGELPLWNPYVYNGLPFIGDAYISFFNPAVVGPLLLFGPSDGGKVAAVVALALSGIGQYWLSRVVGQGRAISLVAGVLGLAAGTLVARLASGFNFGQSMQHAWMALTLAAFIMALRTRRPAYVALTSVLYALLFHAGNLYLWLVLSAVLLLFGAGYALTWDAAAARAGQGVGGGAVAERGGRPGGRIPLGIDLRVVGVALAVAVLGTLLDAVLLLPMSEIRNGADKPIDVTFSSTQPPLPTLFSFVVSDRAYWSGKLFGASDLGWTVHYAYLGGGLFAFLLFLVPAFRARPSRDLLLLVLGCLLTLALASARHTFVWELWRRWEAMQQLRFWATATHATTILLIPLCLAGADYLWRALARAGPRLDSWGPALSWPARPAGSSPLPPSPAPAGGAVWRLGFSRVGLWALLLASLWGVMADPWRVNQALLHVLPRDASLDRTFAWLRDHDGGAYTVLNHEHFQPGFASFGQVVHGVPVLNSTWLFKPRLRPTAGAPDGGLLTPAPRYVIQRPGITPPPGAVRLATVEGGEVLTAPPGLPFAFVADPQRLPYGAQAGASALATGRVVEATARFDGPNRLVVQVPPGAPPGHNTLVVMQSGFPGWRARAGSGPTPPVQVTGGFLSLSGVRPGETYVLTYLPPLFVAGAALSAVGLLAVAGLLVLEWTGLRPRRSLKGLRSGAAPPPAPPADLQPAVAPVRGSSPSPHSPGAGSPGALRR